MNEFELLVFDMREAQKLYYITGREHPRKHEYLLASKKLEKQVDDHLYNVNNPGLF